MKIFLIFILFFANCKFQDSTLFYDVSLKKNLEYSSKTFDFILTDKNNKIENTNFKISQLDRDSQHLYFNENDSGIPLKVLLWEAKISNLYIFSVKNSADDKYKIKLKQENINHLNLNDQQDQQIESFNDSIELQKAQNLETIFFRIFFPQQTIQDDLFLETQMMNSIIMKRVFNILRFVSGNFDSVLDFQYDKDLFLNCHQQIYDLAKLISNEGSDNYSSNPLDNFQYIYKPKIDIKLKKSQQDFKDDKNLNRLQNSYSGFQNFKTDPFVFLNLDKSQLTLGNTNIVQLTRNFLIKENDKQIDQAITFEIDFENGFQFFSNPIEFLSSFLEKVESNFQDRLKDIKDNQQEDDQKDLDKKQQILTDSFSSVFVAPEPVEYYFENFIYYFTEFLKQFYEHTVFKYTVEAVPYQYYREQYLQKLKEKNQYFDQKINPNNQETFRLTILSQILEFFLDLQNFSLAEFFSCFNLDLEEKNGTNSKCQFFMKQLIDSFQSNPQNKITVNNLKNLALGNYDQSYEFYELILKQYIDGYFHLTFKKYIEKNFQKMKDSIPGMITQKLSFAKKRLLI